MTLTPIMAMNEAKYSFEYRLRPAIKMPFPRKLNFAYTFRPIYYFCRVFGLMPFKITYHSNGTIHGFKIGAFDILWCIISMSFNLILASLSFKNSPSVVDLKTVSIILVGGDFILQIFSLLFDAIVIGMDLCFCSKLVRILKKINNFDDEVS